MEHRENRMVRLYILGGLLVAGLLVYLGVLYKTQIIEQDYYLAQSIRTIAREETVEASRGIITDRSGKVLVSNRSTYDLTFDSSLLKSEDDPNQAILRLLQLCQERELEWVDNLPISREYPYTYTVDDLSASNPQRTRFLKYLRSLSSASALLRAYLLQHPEALEETDENGVVSNPADEIMADAAKSDEEKSQALLDALPAQALTAQLLTDAGLPAATLLSMMRESLEVPASFSQEERRMVLGVQYELAVRKLVNTTAYVLVEDIDTELISILNDGDFTGAKVISSSVREYATSYAAHVLGTVGRITDAELQNLDDSYSADDWVGKFGAEMAFEEYLRGTDGRRIVSTNSDGKITGQFYSKEPEPGSTVELTIDLDLQMAMEDALSETVSAMNAADGNDARGAAATAIKVGTGEILALASYPTFDLSTYRQDITALSDPEQSPGRPLINRATSSSYAPGSTFKPLIAVAALEEGKVSLTEKVQDSGYWVYPDLIAGTKRWGWYCWNRSGHGRLGVTQAITASCNYFFYEMGYRLGIDTIDAYATAFGLGQSSGIEIGETTGTLAGPEEREAAGGVWYGGDTVQAAIGQSDNLFTPVQLANYIATLVSGGEHYSAHLLKAVKSYDNSQVLQVGDTEPLNTIQISDSTLNAVKAGMHDLTTSTLATYFNDCVVDAGAKTGTVQLSTSTTNNGVFVCFAPYEDPQIALAIVIEKGGSGAALASTAVKILNAYFTSDEIGAVIVGENELLQ